MMYSIIKNFILIFTLCSISFSQTGNDFLNEYPFGKNYKYMNESEYFLFGKYRSMVQGISAGNHHTIMSFMVSGIKASEASQHSLHFFTCGMPLDQQIRIIKKWCDNNPDKTHISFGEIAFAAFTDLNKKSPEECSELIEKM